MKLWSKEGNTTADFVEKFTVGNDRIMDLRLAKYDVAASKAHAQMLSTIGLLTEKECTAICDQLLKIEALIEANQFVIEDGIEDIHSQIELLLTRELGDIGKKIHSGRSRNDQVLVAIKLYLRSAIKQISHETKIVFDDLIELSNQHKDDFMPGYTHMQLAMPSSFGLWFGAYAESLIDDMEMMAATYHVANKNPLGSGSGYGSSFPLDRKLTTELLQFEQLNVNVIYAQMTRGKSEKVMAMAMANIASTLSKLADDLCLFMNQHFGFIAFPDSLTTGSSIMPHKKNPDMFELIRAKCNRIQSLPNELIILTNNMNSGYHRDFQMTKEILFPAIDELLNCLQAMHLMLPHVQVTKQILEDKKYDLLFSVENVNAAVLEGMPFREAYKKVGNEIGRNEFMPLRNLQHTHLGSIGNLGNDLLVQSMNQFAYLYQPES